MTTTLARTATATITDAGELAGLFVPWNEVARVADSAGGPTYLEQWSPGSVTPAGMVPVYAGHVHDETGALIRGPLIGRVANLDDTADGLTGTVQLANTPDAQNVRELARTVGAWFSVEVVTTDPDPEAGASVVRTDGLLTGLSVLLPPQAPAYPSALVTHVRSAPTMTLTDTDPTPTDPEPTDPPAPPPPPTEPGDDDTTLGRAAVAEMVRGEVARYSFAPITDTGRNPLARFNSFAEFAEAEWFAKDEDEHRLLGRALADQLTGDSPGLDRASWVADIKGILEPGRPFITSIGVTPDTGTGMDVNWPYVNVDLTTLIGEQLTEKSAITSVKVPVLRGTKPIRTFGGGSDISYQALRRLSPSYRDAYLRIMTNAYALFTDTAAATDALDEATGYVALAAGADGPAIQAAVFQASVDVQAATGAPASVVLASTDLYVSIGGKLTPRPVVNVVGSATASTLSVDVSGLNVVHVPHFPTGTALATNKLAAGWLEDGPFTVQADDVEKLGQNVAVWGMGALTTFLPAGLVVLAATPPVARSGSGSKASKGS